ncbi:MAG: competence/damage-inducible protein A [Acidobacteriota bacterium]
MSDPAETRAAILAIGSEMLGPERQDTNSLWLTARLEEIGIGVVRKAIIGDDPDAIVRELETSSKEASLLISTGGLGPTADDVTAAAVGRWLRVALIRNADFVTRMRARFEARGVRMAAVNEKQADFIEGARVLENPRGTAPGFWAQKGACEVVVLPGVPSEMREIMQQSVLPELARRAGGVVSRRKVLRIAGMGESAVEEMVEPVYARWKDHPVTILASPGEVQLHLRVRGAPADAEETIVAMERDFRSVLGERVSGADTEDLPSAVGRLLRDSGKTLALAESCTGGMVASLVTDVPGSSDYFLGGVVSYGNEAKESLLGVSSETLLSRGAVSEESVLEMARGARERFDSDVAAAVTGIAGPGGGTAEKPVGLVWFGIVDREGAATAKRRFFVGDRTHVRRSASVHALELVRRHLIGWKTPDA